MRGLGIWSLGRGAGSVGLCSTQLPTWVPAPAQKALGLLSGETTGFE